MFGIEYISVDNVKELSETLMSFYSDSSKSSKLLEIITPKEQNDKILKEYFNYLKLS